MRSVKHAVIIGAGIAGPTTALALAKAGISSTIYEAYPAASEGVGASLMLAPNGVNAMKVLGLAAAIGKVGTPIPHMIIANGQGKLLTQFSTSKDKQASLVVTRSDLGKVLHHAAVACGIPVHYGKRVVSIAESAQSVQVHFDDGTSAVGDILIGADGIHSTVRCAIDSKAASPQYAGFLGFGGGAPNLSIGPRDAMTFVFGKNGFFGYWTDPQKGMCWFGSLPHATPASTSEVRQIPANLWLLRLRDFYGDDQPARQTLELTDPEQLVATGASEMMPPVSRWHTARMVLVGDSVHAPSSSSGQGASLAIESAIVLAQCLRDLDSPEAAFRCYEAMRRPRVEQIAATAAKSNNQKAMGPIGRALMHALMPIALKTFFNPTRMLKAQHDYLIDWDRHVGNPLP